MSSANLLEYHSVPSEADYCSTQPDLSVPIVRDTMDRNRCQLIELIELIRSPWRSG